MTEVESYDHGMVFIPDEIREVFLEQANTEIVPHRVPCHVGSRNCEDTQEQHFSMIICTLDLMAISIKEAWKNISVG